MGAPYFELRSTYPPGIVTALSANFALYGDMSARMMSLAAGLGPEQEIYSIDESFIGLAGVRDVSGRARRVRERILSWLDLPCGVGIGPTKTLAKLANHVAKSAERKPGSYPAEFAQVCNLAELPLSDFDAVLAATAVGDIWGVGPRIEQQLQAAGVQNALQLARMDPAVARRRWSVVFERTVRELQGMPCISLDDAPGPKKEIACTRSFGRPVTALQDLVEAVTTFCARAAEKLRTQRSHACLVRVFVHTSPFRRNDEQFSSNIVVPLRKPTSDTALIAQAALMGLKKIYRPGYNLAKAGVMLLDLIDATTEQHELSLDVPPDDRGSLMDTMDRLNRRYGRGTVTSGIADTGGRQRSWQMRQEMRTPDYTTSWEGMPIVRA